jgi:hypothetical protein
VGIDSCNFEAFEQSTTLYLNDFICAFEDLGNELLVCLSLSDQLELQHDCSIHENKFP